MIPSSIGREPERSRTDRADLYALLDEVPHGVLASVNDGSPWLVPMLFARAGDRILLHGSTGAGALRYVAADEPVALAVTSVDGIVVSYNTFHSSANYRSAVVNGVPQKLTGDEAWQALNTMSDRLVPGRTAEVRDMTKKEQASTLAIALPIEDGQWTMKVRAAGAGEPEEETGAWMGVVDVRTTYGPARPEAWSTDRPLPASVRRLIDGGPTGR